MYEKAGSGRQCQLTFNKRSGATKSLAPRLNCAVALLLLPFLHIVVLWIWSFSSIICKFLALSSKSAFCHNLLSRHKVFDKGENGKVFQSFSLELGVCHTTYIDNWDALWDTVLQGIRIVCLTLHQHRFSTRFLELQEHI